MSGADQTKGRGRLSSIDLLPSEADEAVTWAMTQLRERKLPQTVILANFNEMLMDLNHDHRLDPPIEPVSKSAFNRYSVRKAILYRRNSETRMMANELAAHTKPGEPDEMTMMIAEMGKIALFALLEDEGRSTKELQEAARALSAFVGSEKHSADRRERDEKRRQKEVAEMAAKVGKIGKKKGVSKEAMAQINQALLGQG